MKMRDPRLVFGSIGFFATPILVVKIAAFSAGAGSLATASASDINPVLPTEGDVSQENHTLTAEQIEARERAGVLRTIESVNSPLLYAPESEPPDVSTDDAPDVRLSPPPEVLVQGLMGGGSPRVMIDGELYSTGDSLLDAPSWTVLEIDVALRQVVIFEHESDRRVTVKVMERP